MTPHDSGPAARRASVSEKRTFDAFAGAAGADDWIVLRSLEVGRHAAQFEGGADFFVFVPGRSIVVIEAKSPTAVPDRDASGAMFGRRALLLRRDLDGTVPDSGPRQTGVRGQQRTRERFGERDVARVVGGEFLAQREDSRKQGQRRMQFDRDAGKICGGGVQCLIAQVSAEIQPAQRRGDFERKDVRSDQGLTDQAIVQRTA